MDAIAAYFDHHHDLIEAVSAFAAAIAAICSLVVAWLAIRQAKGSVRPIPFIEINDYVDDVAVSVRNFGIGPLTISSLIVANSRSGEIKDNVIDFMPGLKGPTPWATFVSKDIIDRPIAPGEEMRLVQYCGKLETDIRNIRAALSDLTITVHTRDVFGRRVKTCTRNLDWFARY